MCAVRPDCDPDCFYPKLWIAHDHPEAAFEYGAWICDCEMCVASLRASSDRDPLLALVLKTGSDRIIVTAEYALAVIELMGELEPLCYVRNDYLREVFVSDRPPPLGARWYSLAMAAHEGFRAGCRANAVRSAELTGVAADDNPTMPALPLRRGRR